MRGPGGVEPCVGRACAGLRRGWGSGGVGHRPGSGSGRGRVVVATDRSGIEHVTQRRHAPRRGRCTAGRCDGRPLVPHTASRSLRRAASATRPACPAVESSTLANARASPCSGTPVTVQALRIWASGVIPRRVPIRRQSDSAPSVRSAAGRPRLHARRPPTDGVPARARPRRPRRARERHRRHHRRRRCGRRGPLQRPRGSRNGPCDDGTPDDRRGAGLPAGRRPWTADRRHRRTAAARPGRRQTAVRSPGRRQTAATWSASAWNPRRSRPSAPTPGPAACDAGRTSAPSTAAPPRTGSSAARRSPGAPATRTRPPTRLPARSRPARVSAGPAPRTRCRCPPAARRRARFPVRHDVDVAVHGLGAVECRNHRGRGVVDVAGVDERGTESSSGRRPCRARSTMRPTSCSSPGPQTRCGRTATTAKAGASAARASSSAAAFVRA